MGIRIFKGDGEKIRGIKEVDFKKESDISLITDDNLEEIFNIRQLSNEFTLKVDNFKIDTLAFSKKYESFVIIEYKKVKNHCAVEQGLSYIYSLKNYKSDCMKEYNDNTSDDLDPDLKQEDVKWDNAKVICIAPEFNNHQKNIAKNDKRLILCEIHKYSDGTIMYNTLGEHDVLLSKTLPVDEKVTPYNETDHFNNVTDKNKNIYLELCEKIIALDGVQKTITKKYISFRTINIFAWIHLWKHKIQIILKTKKDDLQDDDDLAEDIQGKKHWGRGNSRLYVKESSEIPDAMKLIKQAYDESKDV